MAHQPDDETELTESGRPRVPRPMPDQVDLAQCPHCGAEVGAGHYVCWNCSKDIRMAERTEADILDEYHEMRVREELRLEARNVRFFIGLMVLLAAVAVVLYLLDVRIGVSILFLLLALTPIYGITKAKRRIGRIRAANA